MKKESKFDSDIVATIQSEVKLLPPWARKRLIEFLGKYCPECGRLGKTEARGYGVSSLSCEGGRKVLAHKRREWES